MEIMEKLRTLFGANGSEPPSHREIMEARREVLREQRTVEQRLDQLRRDRADLLLEATAEEIEAHDAEIRRTETEVERLEATASELADRAKSASEREKLKEAHETLERLPELAADFEEARDHLRKIEDTFAAALARLAQLEARLRRRGRSLSLPEEDLERLQASADHLPGERDLSFLRAPAAPDPNKPRIVVHVFEGTREFYGDWSDEELRQVGAMPPYVTGPDGPRDVFHDEPEEAEVPA